MYIREAEFDLPVALDRRNAIEQVRDAVRFRLAADVIPLRFAITKSRPPLVQCTVSVLETNAGYNQSKEQSIFTFVPREMQNSKDFNVVFLVPTGIGAEVGGHAGDATPAARLVAETCDTLILHPNVVNASDINEMPENALYVEGSVVTRLLMGTVGLVPALANRVIVIMDEHEDKLFGNATINAVNAARASYGLACTEVIELSPPMSMKSGFTQVGIAAGEISGFERIFKVLQKQEGEYDAVAISSVISVPEKFHREYFDSEGKMINPWGGVEAMLTHAISHRFNVPSAHAPMLESRDVANFDPGVVEPRLAAEAISLTFFQSVLKGLHKSPRLVTDLLQFAKPGVISASDISCIVIPYGCLGLPTMAALEQGISVIAVRENRNLMENDLTVLPWRSGQLHVVENYWEAAGVLCAIRGGIAPETVRRPIRRTHVRVSTFDNSEIGSSPTENTKVHG